MVNNGILNSDWMENAKRFVFRLVYWIPDQLWLQVTTYMPWWLFVNSNTISTVVSNHSKTVTLVDSFNNEVKQWAVTKNELLYPPEVATAEAGE